MYIESLKDQQKSPFYIAELENGSKDWTEFEKKGISRTLYFAYEKSKKTVNELIDFDDIIWANDVEAIVKVLKKNDIREFTISCHFCDLIDRLADFDKFGCRMNGVTEVKSSLTNLNGSVQMNNALRMEIL